MDSRHSHDRLPELLAHEDASHFEAGRQGDVAARGFHEAMTPIKLDGAKRRVDLDCGRAACPATGLRQLQKARAYASACRYRTDVRRSPMRVAADHIVTREAEDHR